MPKYKLDKKWNPWLLNNTQGFANTFLLTVTADGRKLLLFSHSTTNDKSRQEQETQKFPILNKKATAYLDLILWSKSSN